MEVTVIPKPLPETLVERANLEMPAPRGKNKPGE
jgi:hypothetical protein